MLMVLLKRTCTASLTESVTDAEGIVKQDYLQQVLLWVLLTLKVLLNKTCATSFTESY